MDSLITVAEAAKYLRKRKAYIYEAIYRGELEAIKTSSRGLRIRTADLDRFVAAMETAFMENPMEPSEI